MNQLALWPPSIRDMWGGAGSASPIPLTSSVIACSVPLSFYTSFWINALSPVGGAVALLSLLIVRKVQSKRWKWRSYRGAVLVVSFLLYPTVSRSVLQMLSCRTVGDKSLLVADYSVDCDTATHTLNTIAALLILAIFCVGFPVACAVVLYRRQAAGRLYDTNTRKEFLFLSDGYAPRACWWESVVTLRKFALVAVADGLAAATKPHRAAVSMLVLVAALVLHIAFKPYPSRSQGHLETASLAVVSLSLWLGLLFSLSPVSAGAEVLVIVILFAANGGFVAWVVLLAAKRAWYSGAPAAVVSHLNIVKGL